ncbi:MAG: pilus assembly protein N-terminal domain-containing protein [Hydrogenovibrio sp.]|uniref:type II and III secretion system protein family protein n=1 Tax=Hydrogenovibrio sp. TaxID=2065821 RepID=UPI00286FF70E|nr:pilus assembly protein N-terminal domain-containing protein [Hydrogenovibrio sp.]MDR9497575.1 pilus assembly protein N-terminal domain-containing protein [Hydrogenovibrio sp.]
MKPFLKACCAVFVLTVFSWPLQGAQTERQELMVSESQLINFGASVDRVFISNPGVLSAKEVSSREVMFTGAKEGQTQVVVWLKGRNAEPKNLTFLVSPEASKKALIEATVQMMLATLAPEEPIEFEVRPIWVEASSSLRRQIDELGVRTDGERGASQSESGENLLEAQPGQGAGQLSVTPTAGNYLVHLKGSVTREATKKTIHAAISGLGVSVLDTITITGNQQLKLSVRVAEVSKGNPFNSGLALSDDRDRYGLFPPGSLASSVFNLTDDSTLTNGGKINSFGNETFNIGLTPGSNLFGFFSILEGHNLARVLARPELIVESGETASFLVGGEVPIPVSQRDGVVTIAYKEYGVKLGFSPTLTNEGRIKLQVAPEVSTLDYVNSTQSGGVDVPALRSRKANTTITLEPGQSFIIGGLIQDEMRSNVSKLPILGDIPVLGALFRSTSFEENRSELAIMVTPTLVEPIEQDTEVRLTGENLQKPSNAEAFFLGQLAEILPEGETVLDDEMIDEKFLRNNRPYFGLETVDE